MPPYNPEGGYRIDSSLVLAFAKIESRFQVQATSPVGARGLMHGPVPNTASHLGVSDADTLYEPGTSLAVGQRYIELLLARLDGNLLELGGAYIAGPGGGYGAQLKRGATIPCCSWKAFRWRRRALM